MPFAVYSEIDKKFESLNDMLVLDIFTGRAYHTI